MNSLIGKSTGIALLMAAALLAALFAMGVFSPTGARADVTDNPQATVALDTPSPEANVKITFKFRLDDDIDAEKERVRIIIPSGTATTDFKLQTGVTEPTVKITQRGIERGSYTAETNDAGDWQIFIGPSTDPTNHLRGNITADTIVEVTGFKNPTSTPTGIEIADELDSSDGDNDDGNFEDIENQPTDPVIYKGLTIDAASVSPDTASATGVTMTVDFTTGEGNQVVVKVPNGYDVRTDSGFVTGVTLKLYSVNSQGVETEITTGISYGNITDGDTITIAAAQIDEDTKYRVKIAGLTNPGKAGEQTVTITPDGRAAVTKKFTLMPEPEAVLVKLSSMVPGAAVQITIEDDADVQMVSGDDILVDLTDTGFVVPSTISNSGINIVSDGPTEGTGATATEPNDVIGSPSNVTVTGSKVSLTIPYGVDSNGNAESRTIETGQKYTITIKQSAGINNPAAAGEKTVKWVEDAPNAATAANKKSKVTIQRVVKLSKKKGTRGTMTTASLLGFADGTATVYLNAADMKATETKADYKLAEVTVASNVGTLEIDTTSEKFMANREGGNEITAVDSKGATQHVAGMFTVSPALAVDPAESPVSKEVDLKLSDWPEGEAITAVQIGATPLDAMIHKVPAGDTAAAWGTTMASTDTAPGTLTIKVLIPANTNRGTQSVKVTGTTVTAPATTAVSASADLKIGVLDLSVQPAMAVPGQVITVQGSGFEKGDTITTVMVGGKAATVREGTGTAAGSVTVNNSGDFIATVQVPSPTTGGIGTGMKTVSVATAAGSGRVAEGSIEILKAAIELDPMESRRGTTVTVSGTGFPASTVIQVAYGKGGGTIAAGTTDASGILSMTFVVPGTAEIGKPHEVKATSVKTDYAAVSAKAEHSTPGATFELSAAEVQRGGSLTITGQNFPAYSPVTSIMIGETEVAPSPSPTTSNDGDFTATITVPGVSVGNYTIKVNAGGTVVAKSIAIVDAPPVVVPDPTITIAPASGIMAGSTITVTGMDFAAGAVVRVEYDGTLVDAPTAGDDGGISVTHTVPADAEAGEVTVTAGAASAMFTVEAAPEPEPEPVTAEVMADPAEATVGDMITISGSNMAANQSVIKLTVGDASVLPAGLITDTEGSFSVEVAAPDAEGEQTITAVVAGSDPVTAMVTIMKPVSTDPAEVFAGVNGLTRAWHLDAETQNWTFYDPDAELFAVVPDDRKLTEVTTGQIITLIVSEEGEFDGGKLFVGTNMVIIP